MRHLLILLFFSAVAANTENELEMEGVETLVALDAPQSQEIEDEGKKAHLALFDDLSVVKPHPPLNVHQPQLRYVVPKSTTAAPTTSAAAAADTFTTAATTAAPAAEKEKIVDTSTVEATKIEETEEKKKKEEKEIKADFDSFVSPIHLPTKEILQALEKTSDPILQVPYLPKMAGVPAADVKVQGNPWGTESVEGSSTVLSDDLTSSIPFGSELDMGETSPFFPSHPLLSHLPIVREDKKGKVEEGEDAKPMSETDIEHAKNLIDALRAMKLDVEETLRKISEGEKVVTINDLTPPPPPLDNSTTISSTPSSTSTSATSTTKTLTTTIKPSTTTVPTSTTKSTVSTSTTKVTVSNLTTKITVSNPTTKATVSNPTTTTTVAPTTTSTTEAPITVTVPLPSTTVAPPTTRAARRSSTTVPPTTATVPPPSSTEFAPTTTRAEKKKETVDEVKSTEAVQIDSDGGVEKAKVIPNNDAVVIVDNTAHISSHRLVKYTKSSSSHVVDNNWMRSNKVVKKITHDNSFLPSDENEARSKVLAKKRHLIQNDGEQFRKRIKKRVKKRITSTPSILTSPYTTTPSTTTSSTTSTPSTSSPPPSSTTTHSPSTLPPLLTPPHSPIQRVIVPRAITHSQPLIQVSPASVKPPQQLQQAVARAAPIYRPIYPAIVTQQPQYLSQFASQPLVQPIPQQTALPLAQSVAHPYSQTVVQPLTKPYSHLPIIRYEPVIVYQPVYGRKKREVEKKEGKKGEEKKDRHSFLFHLKQKPFEIKKGVSSRFSRLHSVFSNSLSTVERRHSRVFEKIKDQPPTVRKIEAGNEQKGMGLLPKSPQMRKSYFEPHSRTKRVRRSADLSDVNDELDEIEKELYGEKESKEEEKHSGEEEVDSELKMIEKMKKGKKETVKKSDLMDEESEELTDMEEEEEIAENEEEGNVHPGYKKISPSLEELKTLEDSLRVDHELMKKHPQGELRLNKGERPKLFSHGRTLTQETRAQEAADYEYDGQIANRFAFPASDSELEQLLNARQRAAEVVAPIVERRQRRYRTTPPPEEIEVTSATRRTRRKRTRGTTTTTTQTPITTTSPYRRARKPATIIPNFHPKETSVDTESLSSLSDLPSGDSEIIPASTKRQRRNRHTPSSAITTTEKPESTTIERRGRPPRVLPKKESAFPLPSGGNRFFYDRDSASLGLTKSPPQAPPTITPPTLAPPTSPLSIEELAGLPRDQLLEELKRLTSQLSERVEKASVRPAAVAATPPTTAATAAAPPPSDEDIVDEEDRELLEAIARGEKNGKESDPFEILSGETTTVATTTEKTESDLFKFALSTNKKGDNLEVGDEHQVGSIIQSDSINEASIGNVLDRILSDVGVGDNSIGTRKRAIEAIMELKKKKRGDSKAKKCKPSTCTEQDAPEDDLSLVTQLQAVNMKHPLARDGKFSLFATNKKSYYILPDGRVLVVNEQSKLARTKSGEDLTFDSTSVEETSIPQSTPLPASTTVVTTTRAPRRRVITTTTIVPITVKKRTKPITTTPFPVEESEYEDADVEGVTIGVRSKPSPSPLPLHISAMKEVVLPWRSTPSPIQSTTRKIHDGGIGTRQVPFSTTQKTSSKSKAKIQKDEENKRLPATTLDDTADAEMTRDDLIKYLESIDLAKTFGGKTIENEELHGDENFEKVASKTAEDEYSDDVEYEDAVKERPSPVSSQIGPTTVDEIDLRQWFTIGKDNAAKRRKKGDRLAESILEAASEIPDEEVADDEFLANESVNLFPDDFVRVLRSVSGGDRVPMKMLRRLGLRLRSARLRRH